MVNQLASVPSAAAALSKLLSVPDEYVVQQATSALMAISVEKESKLLVMNHAGAILIPLIKTGPQVCSAIVHVACDLLPGVALHLARVSLDTLTTQSLWDLSKVTFKLLQAHCSLHGCVC